MSHDIHAAWATAQIAREINSDSSFVFNDDGLGEVYAFASREGRNTWPIADGVVALERQNTKRSTAIEFKRTNEGLHGILTALGQAHAYLQKGYTASFVVIPDKYESHLNPGGHIASVIDYTSPDMPIAVFVYSEPDPTQASPFEGRIRCERKINYLSNPFGGRTAQAIEARTETQWAHLREGSSDPDAFFKYLQVAKQGTLIFTHPLPEELKRAVTRIAPATDVFKYLSFASGDAFADKVWRKFWFQQILTGDVPKLYEEVGGRYEAVVAPTNIIRSDGLRKVFFAGRSDSPKNKIVNKLNAGEITQETAWEEFAINIHNRAHSYREDIDSGLEHLGMLEADGRPSTLGYSFVDASERTGDSNMGLPRKILGQAILKNGQLGAWLHYVYRLSENEFSSNPLAFTDQSEGRLAFKQTDYLLWLEDRLANELNVMRKVSVRGGTPRKPFQAELAVLRSCGFVGGFRVGIGLEVRWPTIQEALTDS